jgi:ABC transport system ATP-binding/permease protein
MHKLIIEDDEGKSVVVPLVRDEITIGRQEGNTVRLTDQNISRKHARLLKQNETLFVEDLGSYNGIRVNGSRIQVKQSLRDGDEVVIGDYKLIFRSDQPSAAPPSSVQAADRTLGYSAQQPFAPSTERDPALVQQALEKQRVAANAPVAAPAPEDEMDGNPTIPVRTLAEERRQSGVADVPPARLVIIGGPLAAGESFKVDKASLVIGRTPENDIVLNHKSISRHHAKLISDGNDFIVVDLESANGVRVNGQKEDRVQLDSGDTVELGHIRMRFVVGDADVNVATGTGSKKNLYIGAGAVALIGILFVVLSGSSDKEPVRTAAEPPAPTVTPSVTEPAAKPAEAPKPAAAQPGSTAELLTAARAAADAQNWEEALRVLREAAALDPASAQVAELATRVQADKAASEGLATLKAQAESGDLKGAQKSASAIPSTSASAAEVPALVEQAKTVFVARQIELASAAAEAGNCADVVKEAEAALAVSPNIKRARELIDDCKKASRPTAVASAPRAAPAAAPTRTKPVKAARSEEPSNTPPAAEASSGDPDQFIKDAQDEWLRGQYAAAIESSRKALKLRPGMMRAYQIIAVCSCSLKDQSGAGRAYAQLDAKNKGLVKSLCSKNEIVLD